MENSRSIPYTYGYYTNMNAAHARFRLANQGVYPPKIESACELGFGQGLSLAINSGATTSTWFGTDIDPSQVAFAKGLSSHYQDRCSLYDQSFKKFKDNSSFGQFDFICLHGIWTWVSGENRRVICDFISKRLKPGGLLYISYNTLPAWSNFLPIQKLMASFSDNNKLVTSDQMGNLKESFKFAERLLATEPMFLKTNPAAGKRMKGLQALQDNYLVHEYLAADFTPMAFDEMAGWLSPLNLEYVCSANPLEDTPELHLTKQQQQFLSEIKNNVFRETCKDLMVNKDFRADYWIKGAEPMSASRKRLELDNFSLLLTRCVQDVEFSFKGMLGNAKGDEAVYRPLLNLMREHDVKDYRYVINELIAQGVSEASAMEAISMLFAKGDLRAIDNVQINESVKEDVKKLNGKIMDRSINDELDINFLGSSVLGGGAYADKVTQMHIRSSQDGEKTAEHLMDSAWDTMRSLGRRVVVNKKILETEKENLEYLRKNAETFLKTRVPIFRTLGILE